LIKADNKPTKAEGASLPLFVLSAVESMATEELNYYILHDILPTNHGGFSPDLSKESMCEERLE
jgi:hypothetical protein